MDNLVQIPMTAFFAKAGLAAGTTTTTTTSNGTVFNYCIKGKAYQATGASNGATPTTDSNTAAAFLPIAVNKAGVFSGVTTPAATSRLCRERLWITRMPASSRWPRSSRLFLTRFAQSGMSWSR